MWAEVSHARYRATQETEPTTVAAQPDQSKMEMAAAVTEVNELDWMSKIILNIEQNLQSERNEIAIIAAKSDKVIESIKEAYDEDGANKLSDEEF